MILDSPSGPKDHVPFKMEARRSEKNRDGLAEADMVGPPAQDCSGL